MNLEIELRKKLYRTFGQVSPKTASIDELEEALEGFNPLILNILNSGIPSLSDRTQKIQSKLSPASSSQSVFHHGGVQ